ncbi:hypothetical protein RUM43_004151 [Polyplax serrata]|uniref:U3 small nucleolar RNA-associated protein 18 homolog n=1 Tax=Polyplax serrata TaxID=468196 RepID=A0AAN8SBB1_POLSC
MISGACFQSAMAWVKAASRKRSSESKLKLGEALGVADEEEYQYLEKVVLGTGTDIFDASSSDEEGGVATKKKKNVIENKKPAWVDEDDECTLNEALKKQNRKAKTDASGTNQHQSVMTKKFKEIMGVPKWAQQTEHASKDTPVDEILRKCGQFVKKPKGLNRDFLQISKVNNLNKETNSEGPVISVVKFHPKSMVAMVAGSSGVVSLFQVDGKENPKLHSLQFKKYPIFCGSFLKNGEELMVGSRFYRYFYCHDLISGKSTKVSDWQITEITKTNNFCVSPSDDFIAACGNTGKIFLYTVTTKEFVDSLQMNCNVTAVNFSQDGSTLYSHGEDGEVYVWDMKTRKCRRKFMDEGCLTGTSIASSENNQFLACGSSSGIVNVYNSESIESDSQVTPLKTFYNIVTPVTHLKFNSTSEILYMGSGHKEMSVKLAHCPSMTVFSNFPPLQCPIKKPTSVDFSVNSGFFAVGDNNGCAHLYRLNHYGNY